MVQVSPDPKMGVSFEVSGAHGCISSALGLRRLTERLLGGLRNAIIIFCRH